MISERAFAKVNLVLHVGRPRPDGMHPIASLQASIDLADEVVVTEAETDEVACPGVETENLATRALAEFRSAVPGAGPPPLRVEIEKRIPVAAGLGGGSADAAAVLRAANESAGGPLDAEGLRALAARLGSDVPGMVESRHALISGVGEVVEPVDLADLELVLLPAPAGLLTRDVYAQLDRDGRGRDQLDLERLRSLAGAAPADLAAALENDLQPAALALRPELEKGLAALRGAGALGAAVSGSGPTVFGIFADRAGAEEAAASLPGGLTARTRGGGA